MPWRHRAVATAAVAAAAAVIAWSAYVKRRRRVRSAASRARLAQAAQFVKEVAHESRISRRPSVPEMLKALKARSPAANWPTCEWATQEGRHACFLSHMKREAGSDARYLNDKLETMLHCQCFLDSNNLVNLRTLCDEVANSDVLVVLLTPSVLRRPWCLLEIFFAHHNGIPVIPIRVVRQNDDNFEFADAQRLLADLAGELDPAAVQVLQAELAWMSGDDELDDLAEAVAATILAEVHRRLRNAWPARVTRIARPNAAGSRARARARARCRTTRSCCSTTRTAPTTRSLPT